MESNKRYSCSVCSKLFKNTKTLGTHKRKFHYNWNTSSNSENTLSLGKDLITSSKKRRLHQSARNSNVKEAVAMDDDITSKLIKQEDEETRNVLDGIMEDSINDLNDEVSEIRYKAIINNYDIKSMIDSISKLKKQVDILEKFCSKIDGSVQQNIDIIRNTGPVNSLDNNDNQKHYLYDIRITKLENQVKDLTEHHKRSDANDELLAKDLIDDTIEIKDMILRNDYEGIIADIPKFRKSIQMILYTFNWDGVERSDVKFLKELTQSSKSAAKYMIKLKFSHLVRLFKDLQDQFETVFHTADVLVTKSDKSSATENYFSSPSEKKSEILYEESGNADEIISKTDGSSSEEDSEFGNVLNEYDSVNESISDEETKSQTVDDYNDTVIDSSSDTESKENEIMSDN